MLLKHFSVVAIVYIIRIVAHVVRVVFCSDFFVAAVNVLEIAALLVVMNVVVEAMIAMVVVSRGNSSRTVLLLLTPPARLVLLLIITLLLLLLLLRLLLQLHITTNPLALGRASRAGGLRKATKKNTATKK